MKRSRKWAIALVMATSLVLAVVGVVWYMTMGRVEAGCVIRDVFGHYKVPELGGEDRTVYRYTLTGESLQVQVIDYGATITAVLAPDHAGRLDDVMLGYNSLEGYFSSDNPYFGATIGRVANRIAGGRFTLDGVTYNLSRNDGNNTLHGGLRGFDKKLWTSQMEDNKVTMEYSSADGEEGFPGKVQVYVTYFIIGNTLIIEYNATSTKRTPINLTSHNYFNLAGQGAGAEGLNRHVISINADLFTEVDVNFIPTGKLVPVAGTSLDLREPVQLNIAMNRTSIDGFDYNYVLPDYQQGLTVAAVEDPISCRKLEVETTQPGLQFYTSNSITSIQGKSLYTRHAAFSLEAQNFPDAINHGNFPNSVIGPGDFYHHITKFKFGVTASKNK